METRQGIGPLGAGVRGMVGVPHKPSNLSSEPQTNLSTLSLGDVRQTGESCGNSLAS